jgi:hypothetical protein
MEIGGGWTKREGIVAVEGGEKNGWMDGKQLDADDGSESSGLNGLSTLFL